MSNEQQALLGVARWPDRRQNREGTAENQEYGRSFAAKAHALGGELARGQVADVNELWVKCREWRVQSLGSDCADREKFALPRGSVSSDHPYATPLIGRYSYIALRLSKQGEKLPSPDEYELKSLVIDLGSGVHDPDRCTSVQAVFSTVGDWIPFVAGENRINHPTPELWWSGSGGAGPLQQRAQRCMTDIKRASNGSQRMRLLGEMHWCMANAVPDVRGSAAKSEMAVRAVAFSVGLELPPFRRGFIADLEAMTTPGQTYAERYADAFDWPKASR